MNDISAMKNRPVLFTILLLTAASVLPETAQAGWRYRYVQYRNPRYGNYPRPAQSTNQVSKPASPQDKPVKFKDLPVNSEFYFIDDKDHKLFPRIKISSTTAKTVATPASPNVTTNPVPAETLVIMKKDDPKKDGEKKNPKAKKDGKQS